MVALPAVLFLLWLLTRTSSKTNINKGLHNAGELSGVIGEPVNLLDWLKESSLIRLMEVSTIPLEVIYFPTPKIGAIALALFLIAVAFLMGRQRLSLSSDFWLPIGTILTGFALLPSVFGVLYMNDRLPYVALLLFCAGMKTSDLRDRGMVAAGMAVTIRLLMIGTTIAWRASDKRYEPLAKALHTIEKGSTLRVILPYVGLWKTASNPPYQHFASYAMLYRQSFVAGIWASAQQLIRRRPDYQTLADERTVRVDRGDFATIDKDYLNAVRACATVRGWDYVLLFRSPGFDMLAHQPYWLDQAHVLVQEQDFYLLQLAHLIHDRRFSADVRWLVAGVCGVCFTATEPGLMERAGG